MLKKIALIGIFAVTSIISFSPKSTASEARTAVQAPTSPVFHGFCNCPGMRC